MMHSVRVRRLEEAFSPPDAVKVLWQYEPYPDIYTTRAPWSSEAGETYRAEELPALEQAGVTLVTIVKVSEVDLESLQP